MALAPSETDPAEPYRRVKGDYVLMLLQCVVGVFAMLLPSFLKRKLRVVIPSKMMVLFAVFLYCAIFLGEVRDSITMCRTGTRSCTPSAEPCSARSASR